MNKSIILLLSALIILAFAGFAFAGSGNTGTNIHNVPVADDAGLSNNPAPFIEDYIIGDLNNDGVVNQSDIDYMTSYLFAAGDEPVPFESGDMDESGFIDAIDLGLLIDLVYPVVPDTQEPVIELVSPDDGKEYKVDIGDKKSLSFMFKVSDDSNISYCELLIDGNVRNTLDNVEKDSVQIFNRSLGDGSYEWKVRCEDEYGNVGVSDKWGIDISKYVTNTNNHQGNYFVYNGLSDNTGNSDSYLISPINLNDTNGNSLVQNDNPKTIGLGFLIIMLIAVFIIGAIVLVVFFASR